ncbi:hypothetical protein D3Y57_09880 [Sphingomonas paeninsulae]|nr:hypothetical protein D3Y57_09880 [Sphingomonas paeninsulae]
MGRGNTGGLLRGKGVPSEYKDPTEAVAWFDDDGALRILVADYENGRRVEYRANNRGSRISYTTPQATPRAGGLRWGNI